MLWGITILYQSQTPIKHTFKTVILQGMGDIYILRSVLFCVKATRYYTSLTVTKSTPDNTNCSLIIERMQYALQHVNEI